MARRKSPLKVTRADGTEEIVPVSRLPKRKPIAHGQGRRARAERRAAANERDLQVSVQRDLAAAREREAIDANRKRLRDEALARLSARSS